MPVSSGYIVSVININKPFEGSSKGLILFNLHLEFVRLCLFRSIELWIWVKNWFYLKENTLAKKY